MTDAGDWVHRAACRDVDPEWFFPTAGRNTAMYRAEVLRAKSVCRPCPVRGECLAWALHHLPQGVAGGRTEDERAELRTQIGLNRLPPLSVRAELQRLETAMQDRGQRTG